MAVVTRKFVRVKICGITNEADAQQAVTAGCDALGFSFFKRSPRYVSPEDACAIIKTIPRRIITIGVFVNAREKTIRRVMRLCRLDMIQLHGNETPEFCSRFKKSKVIKAFRVGSTIDPKFITRYKTFAYLFDSEITGRFGGTGKKFDWKLIRHIGDIRRPLFLSGGLSEANVREAIACVCPDWVDVCSSIEMLPGRKDTGKVQRFIKRAKEKDCDVA